MDKIIKLTPAYKDYVWGGDKLKKEYNKNTPYEITAESWELSCHRNGLSCAWGGELDGTPLSEIIASAKESGIDMLGTNCERFSDFPILIKLIDANASLSIQVHPDDEYARRVENGYGKTEVWYVVSADEGAELVYGFARDVSREEVRSAIERNELLPLLNSVPVKAGDVFFVESGLLHAIGKGILICEIQQNSDTTYRVYDWGRVGADGKPRELHIEKSLEVLKLSGEGARDFSPELISECCGVSEYRVADCNYFKVTKRVQKEKSSLVQNGESFAALNFLSGEGYIESDGKKINFNRGDCFFVSAECAEYSIVGDCELLISRV